MPEMRKPPCNPEGVALRLKTLIEMHGGISAVSRTTGVPIKSLNHYAQGDNLPGAMTLGCICAGLGVSADWVLFGEMV